MVPPLFAALLELRWALYVQQQKEGVPAWCITFKHHLLIHKSNHYTHKQIISQAHQYIQSHRCQICSTCSPAREKKPSRSNMAETFQWVKASAILEHVSEPQYCSSHEEEYPMKRISCIGHGWLLLILGSKCYRFDICDFEYIDALVNSFVCEYSIMIAFMYQ